MCIRAMFLLPLVDRKYLSMLLRDVMHSFNSFASIYDVFIGIFIVLKISQGL